MATADGKALGKTGGVIVIALRLIVGLTFVVSGWSKSIDPWGFIYKIEEYLNVWNYEFPRELTLTAAVALAVAEFTIGLMIAAGALRRSSVWIALAFMAVMLPLTAYIYYENPVSDCGCFGDLIVLSNTDTFIKNIILTVCIIILIPYNWRIGGLYAPGIQWLAVFGTVAYALMLAFYGYRYQPLVDFRPYKTGSVLYEDVAMLEDNNDSGVKEERFLYSRDGETRSFALDELPDSTWVYVGAEIDDAGRAATLAVIDDGEDITEEAFNTEGDLLLLAVSDPGIHYLTRARLANELSAAVHSRGGRMIALVAADGETLDTWLQLALPTYEVYPSEDTSLKELVRGDAGMVYVRDGRIAWKRNMSSIRYDVLRDKDDADDFFSGSEAVDDGKHIFIVSIIFLLWMIFVYSLNFPNNILDRYFERHSQKKS